MVLTQKERGLLCDLRTQEQLCIEKYNKYSALACDAELQNLFKTIASNEQNHLNTVNGMLGENAAADASFSSFASEDSCKESACDSHSDSKKYDAYLCQDALAMEKHASSLYDVSIFEFGDTNARNTLNQIQKEEQNHGQQLYSYLSSHNLV